MNSASSEAEAHSTHSTRARTNNTTALSLSRGQWNSKAEEVGKIQKKNLCLNFAGWARPSVSLAGLKTS